MVDNKEYVERPQWQSYEDLSKSQRTKVWKRFKGYVLGSKLIFVTVLVKFVTAVGRLVYTDLLG